MNEKLQRIVDAENEWTVIVDTTDDGVLVFHFDDWYYADNFAKSLNPDDNYVVGIVRRPFYILHLENKFN